MTVSVRPNVGEQACRRGVVISMNFVAPLSGPAFVRVVVLVLAWTLEAHAAPLRVCAFGFNSDGEITVIRSHLSTGGFDFTDFSADLVAAQASYAGAFASPAVPEHSNDAGSWLLNQCQPDLRCDIVVYSGEFAGRFFGRYGSDLKVQELEEASCQTRCQGLFHEAQEVFLLACNTLATKDRDNRTPQEYLQVLLDHGFDHPAAERVVELRYGPLGPSFRESFRRIFMGVPRIYGFSSVAPNAEVTASRLQKYFHSMGDYRRYLKKASGDTGPNRKLLTAFRWTSLVQTSGMTAVDPQAAERDLICGMYDDTRTVVQRLRIVEKLLDRDDFLSFLPSIQLFFKRHPPQQFEGEARQVFIEIQRNHVAREQVVRLVRDLDVSVLKMELAHFARELEWITGDEFRRLAVDGARQWLAKPLTSDVVDVVCDITRRQPLGDAFWSEDVPDVMFHDAQGIRLVACLSPAHARVSPRLLAGLQSEDPWARRWAAYALSQRLPLDGAVLEALAGHLDDTCLDVRERLQWILKAQRPLPDGVRQAVRANDLRLAGELQP